MNARLYTHAGITATLPQWAQRLGVSIPTMYARLRWYPDKLFQIGYITKRSRKSVRLAGLTAEEYQEAITGCGGRVKEADRLIASRYRVAFTYARKHRYRFGLKGKTQGRRRLITHNGETLSVTEWAARRGITRERMRQRLNDRSIKDAIEGNGKPWAKRKNDVLERADLFEYRLILQKTGRLGMSDKIFLERFNRRHGTHILVSSFMMYRRAVWGIRKEQRSFTKVKSSAGLARRKRR